MLWCHGNRAHWNYDAAVYFITERVALGTCDAWHSGAPLSYHCRREFTEMENRQIAPLRSGRVLLLLLERRDLLLLHQPVVCCSVSVASAYVRGLHPGCGECNGIQMSSILPPVP